MSQAGDRKTWLLVDSHGYEEQSLEFFEELIHVTDTREVVDVLLHSVRRSPSLLPSAYQIFAPLLSVEPYTSSSRHSSSASDEAPSPPLSEDELTPETSDEAAPEEEASLTPVLCGTPPPPAAIHPLDDPARPTSADRTRAMLQDPYLARGLRIFLREHRHEEQYLFWRATETYRANWHQYRTLHTCVRRIWERFLGVGTAQQVTSVPSVELERIENALARAQEQPDAERQWLPVGLFDVAQREVIRTLEEEWIPQFKQDTAYIEAIAKQQQVADVSMSALPALRARIEEEWSAREWALLLSMGTRTQYSQGEFITQRGEFKPCFFVLDRGELSFSFDPGDRQAKQMVATRGAMFGHMAVLRTSQRCLFTVEVESASVTVWQISLASLFAYLRCHPERGARFFRLVGDSMAQQYERVVQRPPRHRGESEALRGSGGEGEPQEEEEAPSSLLYPLLVARIEDNISWDHTRWLCDSFPALKDAPILLELNATLKQGTMRKSNLAVRLFITAENLYYLSPENDAHNVKGSMALSSLLHSKPQPADKSLLLLYVGAKKIKLDLGQVPLRDDVDRLLRSLSTAYRTLGTFTTAETQMDWTPSFRHEDWAEFTSPPSDYQPYLTTATFSQGDVVLEQGRTYQMIAVILQGSCSVIREGHAHSLGELGVDEGGGWPEFFLAKPQLTTLRSNEDGLLVLFMNNDFIRKRLLLDSPSQALGLLYALLKVLNSLTVHAYCNT